MELTNFDRADIYVKVHVSLNAHRPDHLQVGHAHHDFFHAVHLQGAHAALYGCGKQVRDAGALLYELFDAVVCYQ